ncbi:cyclic nucleotide-binding domain-containing protein [Ilumatobacter sp.]|uniref:cyclic nucleotide-binding domain-containing protein n=1 Tax=Ilumatobacter sp. TaxID=1967498 RepID=UPI003C415632
MTTQDGEVASSTARDVTLASAVSGVLVESEMAADRTSAVLRAIADATDSLGAVPYCRIVPFAPGRRSNVEEFYPGLGSSDCMALLTGGDPDANRCVILFDVGPGHPRLVLEASMSWKGLTDDAVGTPIAGWDRRRLEFDTRGDGELRSLVIHPEVDFVDEDLGFAHGFQRRATIDICMRWDGVAVAGTSVEIDVCDVRNLGSLYGRVLDGIVAPDVVRQAAKWPGSVALPESIHHPWAPVLIIGTEKAALYTSALVDDIVEKFHHLLDPAWLMRVGVHLEMLTCLGIVEAVRDDLGDLLTPDERRHFESGAAWAEIRERIDVAGWMEVWGLRKISAPRIGLPRAGAVSALNLIQKKRATLAFLHTHHEDLKQAILLAGPNLHDAQETWQRVFRDAERAVLRKTADVFPELGYLPGPMREVSMWQQQGVAGQQGLYPTACNQYRASMNSVAKWAKDRNLMDYTDDECIPVRASLLEAIMNDPDRVDVLEHADGYGDTVDLRIPAGRAADDAESERMLEEFEELLGRAPILRLLSRDELRTLAAGALPLLAVPGERIVVQGAEGDSLFVVADGEVEVLIEYEGRDRVVDTMGPGAVIGEMALLTGERRNATVRAIDTAMILQIGTRQYESILRAHPEWVNDLALMMQERLVAREKRLARKESVIRRPARRKATRALRDQISERFSIDVTAR